MTDQKILALRRILDLDAELEPLEDSFEPLTPSDHERYTILKSQLLEAEQAYYQLSGTQASPWSLVTRIMDEARAVKIPEPIVEPELEDTIANALVSELWFRAYLP